MTKYAIGLDFGTLSVRAILVDIQTGEEKATSVYEYPHSVMETNLPTGEKLPINWALQHPQDYLDVLEDIRSTGKLEQETQSRLETAISELLSEFNPSK
mgnify:CR=1 FL=1